MKKTNDHKITFLFIILTFIVSFLSYNSFHTNEIYESVEEEKKDEEPVALNFLLSNLDSDLKKTKNFDSTIESFMNRYGIVGASLAIMYNDSLIYAKGYGYANKEEHIKTDVSHIFRVASISKLVTAVAIMKLQEDSLLNLSDKVFGANAWLSDSIYLSYRDKRVENITIENLIRHQGGFASPFGDPMFLPILVAEEMHTTPPAELNTIIEYVLDKRLRFTPGYCTRYSNVGYGILSKIIEKASGESYESYVKKHILEPAGCYDMHLGHSIGRYCNEVTYYEPGMDSVALCDGSGRMALRSCGGNYIESLLGAGAWVASPSELLKFLSVIDGCPNIPDILSEESVNRMMQHNEKSTMPMGWMSTTQNGNCFRTGTFAGTSAMLCTQSDGYAWAIITNTSRWEGPGFTRKLKSLMQTAMSKVEKWPVRDLFDIYKERQFFEDDDKNLL